MAQPPSLRAQFPSGPLIDETGEITPVWRAYFSQLYIRTGGAAGASSDTTQLQADLDAEEAARQAADQTLTTGLAAERTAREAADSAEAAARAQADAKLLPLAGGTMTGNIILPAATPTLPRQAVSKSYVDGVVGGAAYAPIDSPPFTGNPTAPTSAPGDADTSIATTAFVAAAVAPALNNVGRNLLHNGLFNVAQRGVGPWTTTGVYTADRWIQGFVGGTLSTTIGTINDANRAQIGDEAATFHFVATTTGGAGATNETYVEQRVEGVRRTAGKTIIVSFWAAATAGTPKLSVVPIQLFGSGGSPSAAVAVTAQLVTLSTTYTRYTATFAMPSVAGKTFGTTAGTDYLALRLCMSAGASQTLYGGVGVQSYVLALWGVQLEIGIVATPLEKPSPQAELAECERFYNWGWSSMTGYNVAGQALAYFMPFRTTMRATPTIVLSSTSYTNAAGIGASGLSPMGMGVYANVVATGNGSFYTAYTASADL